MRYKITFKLIFAIGLIVGIIIHMPVLLLFISEAEDEHTIAFNNVNHVTINKSEISLFGIEQRRRLSRLNSVCDSNKNLKYQGTSLKHIVIDRIDGLTYCPVYKAASSSWYILLLELREKHFVGLEPKPLIEKTFKIVKNRLVMKASVGTEKVVVVRHPFERLVSCYRDKFENMNKDYYYRAYGEKMVKKFRDLPRTYTAEEKENFIVELRKNVAMGKANLSGLLPNNPYANPPGPNFKEFAQYVASKSPDDEHWRTYINHCSMCSITYDYILRFENLYNETKELLDHVGLGSKAALKRTNHRKLNVSFFDIVCLYMKQLTLGLVNSLKKKYRFDFEAFEYDPNKYSLCSYYGS